MYRRTVINRRNTNIRGDREMTSAMINEKIHLINNKIIDAKKRIDKRLRKEDVPIVDIKTLTNIKNIPLGRGPLGIALTKDNKFLLVADWYDDKVRVIDTNHLNLVQNVYSLKELIFL